MKESILKGCLIVVLGLIASVTNGMASDFDAGKKIGLVTGPANNRCLTIATDALEPGITVQIITPEKPQKIVAGRVGKKLDGRCDENVHMDDAFSYSLILKNENEGFESPAFALTGATPRLISTKTGVRVGGDSGKSASFRSCTSVEGAWFTVWAGPALKSQKIWGVYYYLGYETEPTCHEKDYM